MGTAAVAAAGGAGDLTAKRYGLVPPDSGGLYGVGETLTLCGPTRIAASAIART